MTSDEPLKLAYQTPGARGLRRRWWYIWMLPIIWLPGAIASCVHVGDAYVTFVVANFPIVVLANQFKSNWSMPLSAMSYAGIVAAGAVLMSLTGAALDLLGTWRRGVFVLIPLAIVVGIMAWHFIPVSMWNAGEGSEGWLMVFHLFWCIGLYVIVVGAILVVPWIRAVQRAIRMWRESAQEANRA